MLFRQEGLDAGQRASDFDALRFEFRLDHLDFAVDFRSRFFSQKAFPNGPNIDRGGSSLLRR